MCSKIGSIPPCAVVWVELCPPKVRRGSPKPQDCARDFLWKEGHPRCHDSTCGHTGAVGPNPRGQVSFKKGTSGHRGTRREKAV